jgi:phytoene dehydrogenase-like protein
MTMSMPERLDTDVVVIGGGFAGLAAATFLARAGRRVTLFEKAHQPGGRARTRTRQDEGHQEYAFNLGPHALYRHGEAATILRRLGVSFSGKIPPPAGYGLWQGAVYRLPSDPLTLLRSEWLRARGKLELARVMAQLSLATASQELPVATWIERAARTPATRALVATLIRVATYANAPEEQSAGAAIAQLRLALRGVVYLDGGWQTLVDGLRRAAQVAGVEIVTSTRVEAILHTEHVTGVRLANGRTHVAQAVIAAVSLTEASALVDGGSEPTLSRWAAEATPIRAASLDVALRRLPLGSKTFLVGIDQPTYLSVHSAYAHLAPEGGALVHAARYLAPVEDRVPAGCEHELEAMLDAAIPGWPAEVVARRFAPHLVVSNALVTAAHGGLPGRPGPVVPSIRGLYVAGDWVGPRGMLADAALASAQLAAEHILATGTDEHASAAPVLASAVARG